jgi:alpha-beta hydrolase superfamily lysophospholipase
MEPPIRFITCQSRDGVDIVGYRWDPAGRPRGAVQLIHGMGEHVQRYSALASALAGRGLVVYGQDHRGHGATARSEEELGRLGRDGWTQLLEGVDLLVFRIHHEQPGLPLVLLGHSMGSFAVQQYLLDHSDRVDAVVLTGTTALDQLEPALDLDKPIDLAAFNAAFQPARTEFDWLSRDESIVDAYIADPRCGFGIDIDAAKDMFAGARRMADPGQVAATRPDLPLYIAAGELDPVNANLALLNVLVDRYRAAGLTDVTVRTYPGARHEILNETNRDEVVADILDWLDRVLSKPWLVADGGNR